MACGSFLYTTIATFIHRYVYVDEQEVATWPRSSDGAGGSGVINKPSELASTNWLTQAREGRGAHFMKGVNCFPFPVAVPFHLVAINCCWEAFLKWCKLY